MTSGNIARFLDPVLGNVREKGKVLMEGELAERRVSIGFEDPLVGNRRTV